MKNILRGLLLALAIIGLAAPSAFASEQGTAGGTTVQAPPKKDAKKGAKPAAKVKGDAKKGAKKADAKKGDPKKGAKKAEK